MIGDLERGALDRARPPWTNRRSLPPGGGVVTERETAEATGPLHLKPIRSLGSRWSALIEERSRGIAGGLASPDQNTSPSRLGWQSRQSRLPKCILHTTARREMEKELAATSTTRTNSPVAGHGASEKCESTTFPQTVLFNRVNASPDRNPNDTARSDTTCSSLQAFADHIRRTRDFSGTRSGATMK